MVLKILLIVSIVLQLVAAATAIGLTRKTKYNFSWILFTIALTAMSLVRCGEYIQLVGAKELRLPADFFVWIGAITSLCFAVAVLFVDKIFKYIKKLDVQRQLTEKRILNTVLRTEEKERVRFSKELHDGLGPLLSSAKLSLSALAKSEQSQQSTEIIKNTRYVIDEAIRSLKEISNNLSPHILKDFGLARGVSNFINKSLGMHTLAINFTTNLRAERFEMDVEVILYRVICELINNSIKHSEGSYIDLTLNYSDNKIMIEYSDNGKGFNTSAMMDVGMGLSNITSRINSLKGDVEISSDRGEGMRASITVDLTKQESWKRSAK